MTLIRPVSLASKAWRHDAVELTQGPELNIFRVQVVSRRLKMIRAFWCTNHNFGDNLNHYLLSRIAKGGVVFTNIDEPHRKIVAIGSILGWCNETTIAWGPGLFSRTDCVNPAVDIRAVRGPLSYKRACECGLKAPEIYGDPALLLPRVYRPPAVSKKYALGIVPHYIDQTFVMPRYAEASTEVRLIDILDTPEHVIDAIVNCERIVSSSLHAIIAAHAYGVPAAWVQFSEGKIVGDGLKYHDYFASVGCEVAGPVEGRDLPDPGELANRASRHFSLEPRIDIGPLLAACPFELSASL